MAETLYAVFAGAYQAEKAAGALLDHGVRAEDLSLIVQGAEDRHLDRTEPAANATEQAAAGAALAGNRVAQTGDRGKCVSEAGAHLTTG